MVKDIIIKAANTVPSERQYNWQQMEFYAFTHFGVNTFTNREWGKGDESPSLFNPTDFDANQWVEAVKSAGMTGLILTAKHHDGFCLWPSAYTEHSVKNSPWKNGKGDVVKEVAEACKKGGIKFGIYLSPWDRHEPTYGSGEEYNTFYKNQLRELMTNYGELFCLWFDGACGEGKNGKKQEYDWEGYYSLIRELQPGAVINICGPDVRWCGNEAGKCRESEWSVVPSSMIDNEKVAEKSQQEDDASFAQKVDSTDEDLGSRKVIEQASDCVWYPCEVDTSIRPGWFYHKNQDRKVKSLKKLIKIYESSVGGNASLLLNIPPDKKGRIADADVKRLKEFGNYIKNTYSENLAKGAKIMASECESDKVSANMALTENNKEFWKPCDGTENAELEVDFGKTVKFSRIVLGEQILVGQRVEKFTIYADKKGKWKNVFSGTVIGYKKICKLRKTKASKIKIVFEQSRVCPTLSKLEVYH